MSEIVSAALNAAREAAGSKARFPGNRQMLAALMEEVGELAKALMELERGSSVPSEVYAEAMQVAATALRIATEGSAEFPLYGYSAEFATTYQPTQAPEVAPQPGVYRNPNIDVIPLPIGGGAYTPRFSGGGGGKMAAPGWVGGVGLGGAGFGEALLHGALCTPGASQ